MKTLFPLVARLLLSVAGFACTWTAAFNYSRLQLASASPGQADWGLKVFLPLAFTFGFMLTRYVWRNHEASTPPPPGRGLPQYLATGAADRVSAGDHEGVQAIAEEVRRQVEKAVKS